MTDIKKLLRQCNGIINNDPECNCAEAADEIERLRAALEEIKTKGRTTGYGRAALGYIASHALDKSGMTDD